jgi:hypothetical protein
VLNSLYFVYQNWNKDQQLKNYKEILIEKDIEIEWKTSEIDSYKETIRTKDFFCNEKVNDVVQKCSESIMDVAAYAVKECKNAIQIARTDCLKDCWSW